MGLNSVFREMPIDNPTSRRNLETMVRWWVENFQRIASSVGTTSDTSLDGTTGHHHTGVDGQGPPVSAVSNTVVTANGSVVWHAGNHGPGSGLNADQVDGLEATSLVQVSSPATITAVHTLNPTSPTAPLILGTNATGQLIPGLNADQIDGVDAASLVRTDQPATITATHNFSTTGAPFTVSGDSVGVLVGGLNAEQVGGHKILVATAQTDLGGSIAAHSIATFSVAVSGASAGSVVMIGAPPGLESGLVWSGRVDPDENVEVRVANITTSSANTATRVWKIRVLTGG